MVKADCGKCGKTWTQHGSGGHCSGCHETFSTGELWERHRIGNYQPGRTCLPAGVRRVGIDERGAIITSSDLIQDREGVWWTPDGLEAHHERVARTREWRFQRRGTENDGLTAHEGTPVGVGEKEGLKSAVTWRGAEKETESTRRDAGRLSERGWL